MIVCPNKTDTGSCRSIKRSIIDAFAAEIAGAGGGICGTAWLSAA